MEGSLVTRETLDFFMNHFISLAVSVSTAALHAASALTGVHFWMKESFLTSMNDLPSVKQFLTQLFLLFFGSV